MNSTIFREGNRIRVNGAFADFRRMLSMMHVAMDKKGYESLVIDLSDCTSAFPNSMLSVCAQVMDYRLRGREFSLALPTEKKLHNLFINTGWAYLLDPNRFHPSAFRGRHRIPVTQYKTSAEQQSAVDRIIEVVSDAVPDTQKADVAAFEWSVNALTENVLAHSNSPIGGLVQISIFQRPRMRAQFAVADAGIGIPASLKEGQSHIHSDTDALYKAIQEGATRDKKPGQGNGLFGSYQICSRSRGVFDVHSGRAQLLYSRGGGGLCISNEHIPYAGTFAVATMDFSVPGLLAESLRFKEIKPARP